jgi:CheY-like chemotaxis protein
VSHTLLLADDSVTIQRVIELTFADEDVNVVAVSDGDEAIAVMDRTPPDIVLADVGMPGRNGYEVAQHVRDTPKLSHIPVVLLTGAFEPIDQAKATAAGCDGVLAKPFEPQLVIGRVKELLGKPKQASSLDAALPPPQDADVSWVPSLTDDDMQGTAAKRTDPADYFERLDQAFANMSAMSEPEHQTRPAPTALDWFASQSTLSPTTPFDRQVHPFDPSAGGVDRGGPVGPASTNWNPTAEPYSYASAPPPVAPFGVTPGSPPGQGWAGTEYGRTTPVPPPPPLPTLPPLADAFAALLAAEQAGPAPTSAPQWPAQPQQGTAAITDELIADITNRVMDQLTDRILSEAIEEKVSQIAERLIREEIERIRKSIT